MENKIGTVHILLVENSKMYQEIISDNIQNLGYQVVDIVDSGEKAIELIQSKEKQIDIVLMDIGLDGKLDGIDTASKIKEISEIPIIYLTAFTEDKMLKRAKVTTPYSYLIKPVDQRVLNINIEIAIHNHKIEKRLREVIEEKDFLIKEVQHRVKNNLQIIQGLLSLQIKHETDNKVIGKLKESESRLHTISLIHKIFYQSRLTSEGFVALDYFTSLASLILDGFDPTSQIKLDIKIAPEIFLNRDIIQPLGLILNEIITNTVKYAFPNKEAGIFFIYLTQNGKNYELIIGDNGAGFNELDVDQLKSMGVLLIKKLSNQIGGTIQKLNKPGSVFKIQFTKKPEKKNKESAKRLLVN